MRICVPQILALVFVLGLAAAAPAAPRALISQTLTSTVGRTIPDAPPGGGSGTPLLDTVSVPFGAPIVGVEVYIDISMTD